MPFNNVGNPELITKSAAVAQVYTPEFYQYLLSLLPDPQTHAELHERLEASYAGSLKGDPEKVKACEADRLAVSQNLAVLHGLAKVLTVKDPTLMDKLGLGHAVERTATGAVTVGDPKDFRVVFDKKGRPFATVTKIAGARGYEVWACDGDPSVESNWRLLVWSTKCQKIALSGLNRTKTNLLKIRGMRHNSPGPWSHYVSLDPA